MSITATTLWPELVPFIRVKEVNDSENPRVRIEFDKLPHNLRLKALNLVIPCAACGKDMHPIRARKPKRRSRHGGHFYYAATCPTDVDKSCSKGNKAHEDYLHVKRVIEGREEARRKRESLWAHMKRVPRP